MNDNLIKVLKVLKELKELKNEIENLDNKTVGDIQRIEVLKRNIELLETGN